MQIQAVIFDLDGTLLDTLRDLAYSVNRTLLQHGFPAHPISAYRYFVGGGVRDLAKKVLPDKNYSDDDIKDFIREIKQEYSDRWNCKTKPYSGIPELLEVLVKRNTKMGVLTNKPHEFAERMAAYYFPKIPFCSIKGLKDGDIEKPDSTRVFAMLRELNVAPRDCLYLGDSGVDMQTAVRAGIYAVGVLWGFRDQRELMDHGAKEIIDKPGQLVSIIEKLSIGMKQEND